MLEMSNVFVHEILRQLLGAGFTYQKIYEPGVVHKNL